MSGKCKGGSKSKRGGSLAAVVKEALVPLLLLGTQHKLKKKAKKTKRKRLKKRKTKKRTMKKYRKRPRKSRRRRRRK